MVEGLRVSLASSCVSTAAQWAHATLSQEQSTTRLCRPITASVERSGAAPRPARVPAGWHGECGRRGWRHHGRHGCRRRDHLAEGPDRRTDVPPRGDRGLDD